jgi:HPr kinase/phosphorylase
MPPEPAFTVEDLFDTYRKRLSLRWLAGRGGAGRNLIPEDGDRSAIVGHLNFIHPHRVQVLGASELSYLEGLGKNSFQDALEQLFSAQPGAVLLAENQQAPPQLAERAERSDTPLLGSPLEGARLIDHINYYLSDLLADKRTVHGVFMDVMGIGVLLTGASAVGKSELALELITRGHRLVADDAPEFTRVAPDILRGSCPAPLHDFIEVRGLGVLNVRAMFGDSAIKPSKNLDLIVNLLPATSEQFIDIDRLSGSRHSRQLLEVEVPEIHLPVAPGRNLAVLVEAAARNELLLYNGYSAAEDFVEQQRRFIEQERQ